MWKKIVNRKILCSYKMLISHIYVTSNPWNCPCCEIGNGFALFMKRAMPCMQNQFSCINIYLPKFLTMKTYWHYIDTTMACFTCHVIVFVTLQKLTKYTKSHFLMSSLSFDHFTPTLIFTSALRWDYAIIGICRSVC